MATIFISYPSSERALAQALVEKLQRFRHEIRYDGSNLIVGDDWRRVLIEEIQSSDAVVVLLSAAALESSFVMSEIGAARAFGLTRNTLLLPVLIGDVERPRSIQDVMSIPLRGSGVDAVDALAADLDTALRAHHKRLRGGYPRIFISHRHKDKSIAEALVRLLEGTFDMEKSDIRCTSVTPYKLPVGERTPDRLRAEIARARAVLGILSPDTTESSYVLFELGAAWGQKTLTLPLLSRGATQAHLPPPISDRHSISLTNAGDCYQLLDDLAEVTAFARKTNVGGRIQELVENLVKSATLDGDAG
jgi:hypothetical protein